MEKVVRVELHDEEPTDTHFVIFDDGVVRSRLRVHEGVNVIRVVIVAPSEDAINTLQCQAASVTVTACGLKYGAKEVKGQGVRWADILRRG